MSQTAIKELKSIIAWSTGTGDEQYDNLDATDRLKCVKAHAERALASLPHTMGVKVKELEWEDVSDDRACHHAIPPLGPTYWVEDDGFSEKKYGVRAHQLLIGNFDDIESAKAAAQADYVARIRSAITIDDRPCTCHPSDNPPVPCAKRYALSECRSALTPTQQPCGDREVMSSGDTVMKSDVEAMISSWQSECKDHPALHNQGNVLLERLKALKPSLAMNDFLSGMDALASPQAVPGWEQNAADILAKYDAARENQKGNGTEINLIIMANYGDLALQALRAALNAEASHDQR